MMMKEGENPCGVCGHYHKYEEGEVCGICGHRMPVTDDKSSLEVSDFPSEILPEFLFLGSYYNASRCKLLKSLGISRILNTVPACKNFYIRTFTFHCLREDQILAFDDAIQFLEQCERDRARVLVHCMSGKNRSPAIVIAYLMKSKGWKLDQSYQWVKERRPSVDITQAIFQQLQDYEKKLSEPVESNSSSLPIFSASGSAPLSFGIAKPLETVPVPAFNSSDPPSILGHSYLESDFTFESGPTCTHAFPRHPRQL